MVHTRNNNMQDKIKSAIFNKYEIPVINKTFMIYSLLQLHTKESGLMKQPMELVLVF